MSTEIQVFRGGEWVPAPAEELADAVKFSDIKYFYPNIIDYVRVVMCVVASFTSVTDWYLTTAALILVSILLDWIDGPIARAYGQCSIFGSGIDWLADVQAQIVTVAWYMRLDRSVTPWLLISTTIELCTCIFDFATTATGKYPGLAKGQKGFFWILEWSMPSGQYNRFGDFILLSYPTYMLLRILELAYAGDGVQLGPVWHAVFKFNYYVIFVPAVMCIWGEAAYGTHIILSWTEFSRKKRPGQSDIRYDDAPNGLTHFGELEEGQQEVVRRVFEASIAHFKDEWQQKISAKETFWVNLWQAADPSKVPPVDGLEELRFIAEQLYCKYFDDAEASFDGFGFVTNPAGSNAQTWHLDYAADYSTVFVPITQTSVQNALQYVKLAGHLSQEQRQKIQKNPDAVDLDLALSEGGYISVRQVVAKPFSILKMDFGTIHRGVANTGDYHRTMLWVSAKKRTNTEAWPEEYFSVFSSKKYAAE